MFRFFFCQKQAESTKTLQTKLITLNACGRRKMIVFGHCAPDCSSLYSASGVHAWTRFNICFNICISGPFVPDSFECFGKRTKECGKQCESNVLIFIVFLLKIRVSFGNNRKFYINLYLYSFSIYNFFLTYIYIFVVLLLWVMSRKIDRCEEGNKQCEFMFRYVRSKRLKAILITYSFQYSMI